MPHAYRRNKLAFITTGSRLKVQFDLFAFTKYKDTKESVSNFFLIFASRETVQSKNFIMGSLYERRKAKKYIYIFIYIK